MMAAAMHSGLVDIVRDFVTTFELARRVSERYRAGELSFEDVERLVEDGERSPLFRLKERSHALFRPGGDEEGHEASREMLFDLAVGALFHEAMKLRESVYQQSVYGPKVRALRRHADPEAGALFGEFENILAATSARLDEAVHETEALLEQARRALRQLLVRNRENGLVSRYLVENAPLVEFAFEERLEALLEEIHGSAGEGWVIAARAYLASGYFDEALRALAEAAERLEPRAELAALRDYAAGMSAYVDGRSGEMLERLAAWLDGPDTALEPRFAVLARAAVTRIAERDHTVHVRARAVAKRLAPPAPDGAGPRRTEP